MKKIIASTLAMPIVAMLFAFAPIASAAVTDWDVRGMHVWTVLGTYNHDIVITTQNPDGTFSGTGGYPAGSAPYNLPGQTSELISGSVIGDVITLTTTYLGPSFIPYTVTATGVIAPDGSISGSSPWAWVMTGNATKDDDGDGIFAGEDFCPDTTDADGVTDEELGTNRWKWNGINWVTKKPKATTPTTGWVIMSYTHGCSGEQILERLKEATGKDFEGHYKYGVSKSILEEWNAGRYYLETITVPADDADGVSSLMNLLSGQNYVFKASGTADACLTGCGYSILFDPEYSTSDYGTTWVDGVAAPYTSYGPNLLDLMVNGGFVNWDDDAVYNPDHAYWYDFVGTGAPVTFGVYNVYYPNNTGNLTVDIYADLW